MRGIILINAYSEMKEALHCAQRLKAELEERGVPADIKRNDLYAVTVDGQLNCKLGYDFCIYLDKDKYVLQGIEKAGIPLFNSFSAIEVCDDKMTTALALAGQGIKMPLTLPAPLCYDSGAEITEEELDKIEGALGYPLIVKRSYGSCGAGVYLVKNRAALKKICGELKCEPHLYQKYLKESFGRDIRVLLIGGKVFGAILRRSHEDFRANIALGGSATAYELPREAEEMCERAASILGLDYCGIDLLFGEDGFYLCEVNSNAFFGGFERATGKNVAGAYADYILSKIK